MGFFEDLNESLRRVGLKGLDASESETTTGNQRGQNVNTGTRYGGQTVTNAGGDVVAGHAGDFVAGNKGRVIEGDKDIVHGRTTHRWGR
ncbi:hypothetical protein ACIRD3_39470 [Kitasatospora sp. NPDC093550]|uniref:hypothetical protein n=1 Tax=Kitasatospora sp. NPDC093550 TaxID=3364089 RepID=UPI00382C57AF